MKRYVPERGDIAWIDFGPPVGHEQANRRPALVLSPAQYNAVSGLALVCPISSKQKGFRFEVPLPATLETQGVVLSDHLRTIDWNLRAAKFKENAPEQMINEVIARVTALIAP